MKKRIVLALLSVSLGSAVWADQVIVPTGSSWKYLDNGSNQGTAWRGTSFSDVAWASGNAELGYGDGGESTVVSYGSNSSAKYATTYFRKTVSIADASLFTSYSLQIKRDDGVVIYVNGTEVYRNNMPTGTIAYNTWASAAVSDDGANFTTVSLPTANFVTGSNTIAVEIHQSGGTSSDISFDLGLTGIGGGAGGNEVVYMWSGATQPTSAVVVAKMSSASTTCKLVVSTSSSLTSPIFSANATASSSNNLMAKMSVTGLAPNTTYYYAIQSGGVTDNSSDDIGTFKTPASGAFSYKFTVGSCAVNSNHQIYTLMNGKAPLFHLSTGDIHYANPNSTDINVHRLPYEQNMLSQTPSKNFFKATAMAHVWDDHDYCGNNSNGSSVGRTNARLSYQEYVPHYTLAAGTGNVAIYQSFTIGRVHFILSDLRSERSGSTMMGTAQKTWFKNQCLYAKANNLMIAWVSGVSFGGNQTDNWGGFTAERTELANFFRDNDIKNMFIMSGDAHMLAIDNGTNHDFSTGSNNPYDYPVFQAAGINNSGSTKGGTYSEGGTFPNPSSSTGQYGVVEVTDAGGSNITIKFTGYRTAGNTASESVLATYTFTRTLTSALVASNPEFSVRSVQQGMASQVSWDKPEIEAKWTVERSSDKEQYESVATVCSEDVQWIDEKAVTGWNYYRMKDTEGNVIGEEAIYLTGKLDVTLVPNPATNMVTVGLDNLPETVTGRYIVYNMKMKTVLQGEQQFEKGNNRFQLDVSTLETGEYLVNLVVNGMEVTEKLVVVK